MSHQLPLTFADLHAFESRTSNHVSVMYGRRANGSVVALEVDNDGKLATTAAVTINPGDIQIGAVELQDGDPSVGVDQVRGKIIEYARVPQGLVPAIADPIGGVASINIGSDKSYFLNDGQSATVATISAITLANPGEITTATDHGLTTGDVVVIRNIAGMTELNNRSFTITVTGTDTFTLDGEDTSLYTAWDSGGVIAKYTAVAGDTLLVSTSYSPVQLFGFDSTSMTIINDDASGYLEFSFDGSTVAIKLFPGEGMTMDDRRQRQIYVRGQFGVERFRVMAY